MGRTRKSQVTCSPKMLAGKGGPLGPGGDDKKEVAGRKSNIDKLESLLDSQPQQHFYRSQSEWAEMDTDAGSVSSLELDSSPQVRKSARLQRLASQGASPPQPAVKAEPGKRKRQGENPEGGLEASSKVVNLSLLKHDEDQETPQPKDDNKSSLNQPAMKTRARTLPPRVKKEPVSPPTEPVEVDLREEIASLVDAEPLSTSTADGGVPAGGAAPPTSPLSRPSTTLFSNYERLLALKRHAQRGRSFADLQGNVENAGGISDQRHSEMGMGAETGLVPYVPPTVSIHIQRYANLTPTEQIQCLASDLDNRSVLYAQAMETIKSTQSLNHTLMNENEQLRELTARDRDIAKRELERSREAWKKLEAMQLYNSANANGAEQRYFLSQKYTDAIQKVKQDCEHRLKALEVDRNQLANQNQVLNNKVNNAAKKQQRFKTRVVKLQKGLVAALSRVVGMILVNDRMSRQTVRTIVSEAVSQVCGEGAGNPLKVYGDCFDAWEHEEKLAESICNGLLKGLGRSPSGQLKDDDDDEFEEVEERPVKKAKLEKQQDKAQVMITKKTEIPPEPTSRVLDQVSLQDDNGKVSGMDTEEEEDDDDDDFEEVEEFSGFENGLGSHLGLSQPPLPAAAVQATPATAADNGKADQPESPKPKEAIVESVPNCNTALCNQTVVVLERRPELDSQVIAVQKSNIAQVEQTEPKPKPPSPKEAVSKVKSPVSRASSRIPIKENPEPKPTSQTEPVSKDATVKIPLSRATTPIPIKEKMEPQSLSKKEEGDEPKSLVEKEKETDASKETKEKISPSGKDNAQQQKKKPVQVEVEKKKTEHTEIVRVAAIVKMRAPVAVKTEPALPQLPNKNNKDKETLEVKQEEVYQSRTGRVRIARGGGTVGSAGAKVNIGRGSSASGPAVLRSSPTKEKSKDNTGGVTRGMGRGRGAANTSRGRGTPVNPVRNRLTREIYQIQPVAKVATCEKMRLEQQWKDRIGKRREESGRGAGAVGVVETGKEAHQNQSPDPATKSEQQKPATRSNSNYKMEDLFGPEEDNNSKNSKGPSPSSSSRAARDDFEFDGDVVDTDSTTSVSDGSDSDDDDDREDVNVSQKGREPEKVVDVEVKKASTMNKDQDGIEKEKPATTLPAYVFDALKQDLDLSESSEDEEEEEKSQPEPEAEDKKSCGGSESDANSCAGSAGTSAAEDNEEKIDFFFSPASPEDHDYGDDGGAPEIPQRVEHNGEAYRAISKLMETPLDVLLSDPNFLLRFSSVHTIQEVAASAFNIIAQTSRAQVQEEMVTDERLTRCPLIPRFATLLAIFRDLSRLYRVKYQGLPGEFCRLFCQKMVEDDGEKGLEWMEDERLLIQVGRFVGAAGSLPYAALDISEIIMTVGGVKSPLLYPFLYGILMSDSTGVLGYIPKVTRWADLALWVRALLVAIYRGPSFSHSFWRGRLIGFLKTLEIQEVVPEELGFDPFFQMLLEEVGRIESQRELMKGAKVIAMMMGQKGWAWVKSALPGLLTQFEGMWKGGRISDGGFGEGVLKGFGLGVSWMRKENLPENVDEVKSLFARYQEEAQFPQTILDAATFSINLLAKMILRQPGQELQYWRYSRKDGGKGREKQPNRKKTAAKRKKQRMARKMKKDQAGGGGSNEPGGLRSGRVRGSGGSSMSSSPATPKTKQRNNNNKGAGSAGQRQAPSKGAAGNKSGFGKGGGGPWWNKKKPI